MAQRYLVAEDTILHGVLQRGIKKHFNRFATDEAHLDNSFSETAMSEHLYNHSFLAGFKFRQSHIKQSFLCQAKIQIKSHIPFIKGHERPLASCKIPTYR